jgi:hypothetical protein
MPLQNGRFDREHGAVVEFIEYADGHGWRENVFGNIRTGIE